MKQSPLRSAVAAGIVARRLALSQPANEALYTLSIADPAAELGGGPFGTVSVTENLGALNFW